MEELKIFGRTLTEAGFEQLVNSLPKMKGLRHLLLLWDEDLELIEPAHLGRNIAEVAQRAGTGRYDALRGESVGLESALGDRGDSGPRHGVAAARRRPGPRPARGPGSDEGVRSREARARR